MIKLVSRILTEDLEQITGGRVILEGEIVPAADRLEEIIREA